MKVNAVSVLLLVSLSACMGMNIVEKAQQLGATTLLGHLVTADLNETLSGDGEFTVFAPTNDAFAALPQDLVDKLQNVTFLKDVLKYHVVSGNITSSALSNEMMVPSLEQGPPIRINIYDVQGTMKVLATGSQVTTADQGADNGVIHVVDKVMLAPTLDIPELVSSDPNLTTLKDAVVTADLVDALKGGNLTVFAPTNAAFGNDFDDILADKDRLTPILQYHVVPSTVYSAALYDGMEVTTLQGDKLTVSISNGNVMIGDATVSSADVSTTNGVVHVIDTVLVPEGSDPSSAHIFTPSLLSLLTAFLALTRYY